MNKQKVIIAGAVMLVFVVILVSLFSGGGQESRNLAKKTFVSDNWERIFIPDDKSPYGLKLFQELVDSKGDSSVVVEDSLVKELDSASAYAFVGDRFSLHPVEFDSILTQVSKGANLFLAYHELTDNIHHYFFHNTLNTWHFEEEITVHTNEKSYDFYSVVQTDTIAQIWNLILPENLIDSNHLTLSYVMETPNFVSMKLGKGKIFLHTNPELFCNYQLLSKDGFNYAQFVISQFAKGHKVKWLELGRLSDAFGNSDTDEMEGQQGRKDDSLLQFLFKKRELLIALLLTILGLILYMIFRSKRYYPVVPYIPQSKNRSLDFAGTMTAIYFNQQSPYSILIVMRKNFRAHISKQFFLDIFKPGNENEIHMLSEKSGIELSRLSKLVKMLENIKMQAVTYEYIQDVAALQREFYIETGIIKQKIKARSEQKKIVFRRQIILSSLLTLAGINIIMRGFYLLSVSNSTGILMWPIGLVMAILGIVLLSRNLIVVEQGHLTYYPYFFGKKVFELDEVLDVTVSKGFTIIEFTGNRKLRVNHFEISYYSRKDFERFIAPFLRLK